MPLHRNYHDAKPGKEPRGVVSSAGDLKEFTCFPKLPIELRIKIWGNACSATRNVDIRAKQFVMPGDCFENHYLYYWYSSCAVPAVLHVSKESRTEGLKHYKPDFATHREIEMEDPISLTMSISTPAQVYINWNNDRLCLIDPYSLDEWDVYFNESLPFNDFAERCAKRGLRHLAINTALDPKLLETSGTEEQREREKASDVGFTWYMPRNTMIEEFVLFENHKWILGWDGPCCNVNGLGFVDVKDGCDRRLYFVKQALIDDIEKSRQIHDPAFRTLRFIWTCKATLPGSVESTKSATE